MKTAFQTDSWFVSSGTFISMDEDEKVFCINLTLIYLSVFIGPETAQGSWWCWLLWPLIQNTITVRLMYLRFSCVLYVYLNLLFRKPPTLILSSSSRFHISSPPPIISFYLIDHLPSSFYFFSYFSVHFMLHLFLFFW